jgi:hypothetical protein
MFGMLETIGFKVQPATLVPLDLSLLLPLFFVLLGLGNLHRDEIIPNAMSASDGAMEPADFAGTATPFRPSSCPKVHSRNISNIVGSDSQSTVTDRLIGCWQGSLAGKKFAFDQYFSPNKGGSITTQYAGKVIPHIEIGGGPPTVVRFTGPFVCFAEHAGAYFVAVNLRTGEKMNDDAAQRNCPPRVWPPQFVLGLKSHKYPISWPKTVRGSLERQDKYVLKSTRHESKAGALLVFQTDCT